MASTTCFIILVVRLCAEMRAKHNVYGTGNFGGLPPKLKSVYIARNVLCIMPAAPNLIRPYARTLITDAFEFSVTYVR